MNKKGQELSMTYIVIAALALVVLVVIILFFTGGIQSLTGGQKEVLKSTVPDWQTQTWNSRCKLACASNNVKDYCENAFKFDTDGDGSADVFYTCSDTNYKTNIVVKVGEKDISSYHRDGPIDVECDDISCK